MAYDLKASVKLADEFTSPMRKILRMFDQLDATMRATDRAWDDIGNAAQQAANQVSNFGQQTQDSTQSVNDLQRQLDLARQEAERLADAGGGAGGNLDDLGETGRSAGNKISGAFKTAVGVIASLIAVDQIKDLTVSMIEAAGSAVAMEAQFSTVFGDMEGEAEKRLAAIGDEATILENRMKNSFTKIAAFAKTGGMDTADSLDLADRSMRAIADSAAFYDRSLEDVTESLQSFLKGNFENDAALGLSATETTRNAAAMDLYGKKFIELDEAQKQLTLLQMVEDANKLTGALGQASRESDGWENVLGNVKQAWEDLKAAIGVPLLEVATEGIKGLTKAMQEMDGEKIAASIAGVFTTVGAVFDSIKNHPAIVWMQENLPAMFEQAGEAIKSGLASEAVSGAVEGITSFLSRMQEVGQQLWDFIVEMGPGVMVVFQDLWAILQPIFNALGTAFSVIGDIVGTVFNTIVLPLLKLVWGAFQFLWELVNPILKLLAIGIEVTFAILETMWLEIIKPVLKWIGEGFAAAYEAAKPALDGIKFYLGLVRDSFDELMGRVDDFVAKIKGIDVPDWVTKGASVVGNFFMNPSIDGSHATGLASTPHDGYIAELHKGEPVLTAQQGDILRGMGILKSSGNKPVIDGSALSGMRTGTGRTVSKTAVASTGISIGSIQVIGHNKPTEEIASEIVDKIKVAISNGALAGVN